LFKENNFYKIIIYTFPNAISILLSVLSIGIFLKTLEPSAYANYLIQHLIMALAFLLNFNIGKITSIKIHKLNNKNAKQKIIFDAIFFSILIAIFFSLFACTILHFLFKNKDLPNISFSIFIGLSSSILYLTFEELCKGTGHHKLCSLVNFFFYGISISLPALFLLIDNLKFDLINNLFNVSLIIKMLTLIYLILFFIKKKILNFFPLNLKIFNKLKHQSIWMTITLMCEYIYFQIDKYFIKLSLGATSLIIYSIPQQLTGKIAMLSYAIQSIVLPQLSKNKSFSDKKNIISANIYFFFYLVSFAIILVLPFFTYLLNWYLKSDYNEKFLQILKIFLLVNLCTGISGIITTFRDSQLKSKKNTIDSMLLIVPFIAGLILCFHLKNLTYFAILMLTKEIILIMIRMVSIKDKIFNFKILMLQIICFIILILSESYDYKKTYYLMLFLFFFLTFYNFPKKLIKKQLL